MVTRPVKANAALDGSGYLGRDGWFTGGFGRDAHFFKN